MTFSAPGGAHATAPPTRVEPAPVFETRFRLLPLSAPVGTTATAPLRLFLTFPSSCPRTPHVPPSLLLIPFCSCPYLPPLGLLWYPLLMYHPPAPCVPPPHPFLPLPLRLLLWSHLTACIPTLLPTPSPLICFSWFAFSRIAYKWNHFWGGGGGSSFFHAE